jgi:hypothetical protein
LLIKFSLSRGDLLLKSLLLLLGSLSLSSGDLSLHLLNLILRVVEELLLSLLLLLELIDAGLKISGG